MSTYEFAMSNVNIIFGVMPEAYLSVISILLLIIGLYGNLSKAIWWIASILLIPVIINLLSNNGFTPENEILGGLKNTSFALMIKAFILSFGMLILIFYGGLGRIKIWRHGHHEYVILILLSCVSGMIAVSASNFLILYTSLEIMALINYVLASYDRESKISQEAGIKYFILGSLSSCIMVFGMSYTYGFSGSLSFEHIHNVLTLKTYSPALLAGLTMFIAGILFKLSIAPFHFWTQDVYQGSPLISVAFFASIPKITVLASLINIISGVIYPLHHLWQNIFIALAVLSMVIGGFGGIAQTSLKRLISYSTIFNMGFILLAISCANEEAFRAAIMFQIIYSLASIGLLATLSITIVPSSDDYPIANLIGFGIVKKLAAFAISIFTFSFIGIPPLAGFFGKIYILAASIKSHLYITSVTALILSVVASTYYLSILKTMYFTQPSGKQIRLHEASSVTLVAYICAVFILLFPFIYF
ncbi:MAG: NADH-quinone oxidoreductase subunit N [Rickettsiaceae bacterium]|nr:NADH-quinone oxidoreductase subunit N [Rickettsiaceae bacterium]